MAEVEEVQGGNKIMPIYFKAKDVPDRLNTLEICLEAEKVAGEGDIDGAQLIKGLWRIYVKNEAARATLLTEKLCLRNVTVELYSSNPYLRSEPEGHYVEIHEVPISYQHADVLRCLMKHGLTATAPVRHKYARPPNNRQKLFKTGSRCLHVQGPIDKLPRKILLGINMVPVWSPDRPKPTEEIKCSNCLQKGHRKESCQSEVVCLACKQPGHRKGQCSIHHDDLEVSDLQPMTQVNPDVSDLTDIPTTSNQHPEGRAEQSISDPQPSQMEGQKDQQVQQAGVQSSLFQFLRGGPPERGGMVRRPSTTRRHTSHRKRVRSNTGREGTTVVKKMDGRRTPTLRVTPSTGDNADLTNDEWASDLNNSEDDFAGEASKRQVEEVPPPT